MPHRKEGQDHIGETEEGLIVSAEAVGFLAPTFVACPTAAPTGEAASGARDRRPAPEATPHPYQQEAHPKP